MVARGTAAPTESSEPSEPSERYEPSEPSEPSESSERSEPLEFDVPAAPPAIDRHRFHPARWSGARAGSRANGFTLVELAIVLVVLGVLARAFLAPFGERLERRRHDRTVQTLDTARTALIAHLVARGALPCPLPDGRGGPFVDGSAGEDVPCGQGQGRLPAAVLGIAGAIDADGGVLDGWGRPLSYSVSLANATRGGDRAAFDWLVPGEARGVGLSSLDGDLSLCRASADGACPQRLTRADKLVFMLVSTGADASVTGVGRENVDGDTVFALVPPSIVAGERFDDLLVWASRDELAYWLLRAEWLP